MKGQICAILNEAGTHKLAKTILGQHRAALTAKFFSEGPQGQVVPTFEGSR